MTDRSTVRTRRVPALLLALALLASGCEGGWQDLVGPTEPAATTTEPAAEAPSAPPTAGQPTAGAVTLPPTDQSWDYQLGGNFPLLPGVGVVERNWLGGRPVDGIYNICYVNAFQTEARDTPAGQLDSPAAWRAADEDLIDERYFDENWDEYVVDISTDELRQAAAAHVAQMIEVCVEKGYDAVELDNLDSWTRDGADWPRSANVAYAALITAIAHDLDLAVAQKNAVELGRIGPDEIGFDFAIAEDCGSYQQFGECTAYAETYGHLVFDVEYTDRGFRAACDALDSPVIRRTEDLDRPADPDDAC